MPNYFTIVFTPTTWNTFKELPNKAIGFRLTMASHVNKVEKGDILICYLAKSMTWCGVIEVAGKPYESKEHIYAKHGMPFILDVNSICLLDESEEISVKMKALWDDLDRFKNVDHRGNGWAVKVGLITSLRKLGAKDGATLTDAITNAKNAI